MDEMKKAVYNILPKTEEILKTMGEQIKLARSEGVFQQNWWQNEQESAALLCGKLKRAIHL